MNINHVGIYTIYNHSIYINIFLYMYSSRFKVVSQGRLPLSLEFQLRSIHWIFTSDDLV